VARHRERGERGAVSGERIGIGLYWAASCGGCDLAVLEIHEQLIGIIDAVELVFWPCIMDFKYSDVERMPDGHIDVCLFNGGIRTEENARIARLLRSKSRIMVAYGACSYLGGIPGLANLFSTWSVLERAFCTSESTSNPIGILPEPRTPLGNGREIELTPLLDCVQTLAGVVDVDYSVPGCPPTGEQTLGVLEAVISGTLPGPGAVIGAGHRSVCDECRLERTETRIREFRRPHQAVPDGVHCLLEQGLVCMGPATRSGCRAACIGANMPCRGCYGPAEGVVDQGAKMIAMLGSLVDSEDEEEIARCIATIVDPVGTFYRFGLPGSILGRSR